MDWEKELDQTAFDLCEQEKYTEAAEYAKDYIRVTIQQDLYELVESGNGAGVYERLRAMYPSDLMNRVLDGVATMDDFFAIATADLFVLMQGEEFLLPDENGLAPYIHFMRRMRFEQEAYLHFVEEEVYRLYRNMKHRDRGDL
ncbi:MAG: hypothetical protein K6A05_07130 [Lachnospiraceae bacterium]|nr:hypothetical protein [Lachnospiraceae bacterium]